MKLLEIAARNIAEFPAGFQRLSQRSDGLIVAAAGYGYTRDVAIFDIAEDRDTAVVTRAQWEAERARIAANQQATKEAREIAKGEGKRFDSVEDMVEELTAIACGKRSKEDQELWDKAAIAATQAFITAHITHHGHGDNIWRMEDLVSCSADYADAFMAERAKRMKG